MAMGQQKDRQGDLMVSWSEMPRSPGHVFYDRLQLVLIEGGFDGFAEAVCQPYYAARMGAPSVPPGRYFRMHLVGYFEGIDSERGLEWRCSDSLSLREFLLLEMRERVPDHSWLSRTRARLPHEVHTAVFDWVLALIAEAGLVKGERAAAERNLSPNGDLREAAVNLFRMLRELDRPEYRAIAVMPIPDHALGSAINDRLRRAAQGVAVTPAAESA